MPRSLYNATIRAFKTLRILSKSDRNPYDDVDTSGWVRLRFHMGMVTAPLIADLFLLAILAIGRQEVHVSSLLASIWRTPTRHDM